jgi:hypothetical protein
VACPPLGRRATNCPVHQIPLSCIRARCALFGPELEVDRIEIRQGYAGQEECPPKSECVTFHRNADDGRLWGALWKVHPSGRARTPTLHSGSSQVTVGSSSDAPYEGLMETAPDVSFASSIETEKALWGPIRSPRREHRILLTRRSPEEVHQNTASYGRGWLWRTRDRQTVRRTANESRIQTCPNLSDMVFLSNRANPSARMKNCSTPRVASRQVV